jgi:cytochrome P450
LSPHPDLLQGVDTLAKALYSHVTNRNPDFWNFLLRHGSGRASPTVEAQIAGTRVIFTADTDNLRAILASQFNDYGKGQGFRDDWHGLLGDSVFSLDGESWHGARQLLRPQFIKDRVSDLTIFERFSQVLIRGLAGGEGAISNPQQAIIGVGKEVDVTSFIHRYTLDTATEFLFGKSVGSLEDIHNEFAEAFEEAQRALSTRTRAG